MDGPTLNQPKRFIYGTSGFRAHATLMESIIRRTAFFAAIRARALDKAVGMMITASHNPIGDNGVKLVDPEGHMLPMDREYEVTTIVNTTDEEFEQVKATLIPDAAKRPIQGKPMVIIATDTRPSSPKLLELAEKECSAVPGVLVEKFERYTTPQLHFIVRAVNSEGIDSARQGFVTHFRDALTASFNLIPFNDRSRYTKPLFVDCANGVGALWVEYYLRNIELETEDTLPKKVCIEPVQLTLLNKDTQSELLNHQCGADYVKIHSNIPANFDSVPMGARCASLDGDADRLVYFYPNEEGNVVLLDGDHIAALFARFIADQFSMAEQLGRKIPLTFGVVQTSYANGNSTRYFREKLGIKTVLTKTGVKYLEEEAQKFDIGIYFEANGHGTVCFSDKFKAYLAKETTAAESEDIPKQLALLSVFSALVNDVVGDGIADLLAVECLLRYFNWSIQDWLTETYTDIPNVQKKLEVKDKSIFATVEKCETVLARPEGIQEKIDGIVARFDKARAFIRPSGTEPIVRIYAEAVSLEKANDLAEQLAKLIS